MIVGTDCKTVGIANCEGAFNAGEINPDRLSSSNISTAVSRGGIESSSLPDC